MKEETFEKPKKDRFQLELDAKMKERRARGLTTALSPSPTGLNQGSTFISDDEDDILSSLQKNSFKSRPSYKSKWNSSYLNDTMQWGDSELWDPGLLHKDDKITDSLDIGNRQSPSWKESPRSFENQKGYLKSTLKSPRNDVEIDSLQSVNSPRSFKDTPNKFAMKDSPRDSYKPERKILSFSDPLEDSSYSAASVIDHSLSSVGDARNKTPSTSSEERFLKSSKKKVKSSVGIEKDEERNNQVETDSVRPVPSVRKKSLTSPRYVQPQELQPEENIANVINKDPDPQNGELSSARSRRHAFKTSAPSSVLQDNLDESSGRNSSSSTLDMTKPESLKASKHKRNSLSEREEMASTYTLGNKRSEGVTNVLQNKNDPELDGKKTKKEKQEKSAFIDRRSYSNLSTLNERDRTFSIDKNSTQDMLDDIKTPFSRRGSLQIENNKINENGDKRDLNSANRMRSPKNPSSVFDFLTKDVTEPKTTRHQAKCLENREQYSPFAMNNKDQSFDAGTFDKDTSSLCEEFLSESRPTPIPRKQKNQLTERQIYDEAIKQVGDFQKSQTTLISPKTNKNTNSLNKTGKPNSTKNAEILDPNLLRENIFQEWISQKNKLTKEQKKKKIQEEAKKKKDFEQKKTDAVVSFEFWKKQKVPILRQKLKTEMTKKEEEIAKEREKLKKKQEAAKLFETWKKEKDAVLKKEYSKKKEEERKHKLLDNNKEMPQTRNVSFNAWKDTKDKVLLQKKKENLKTLQVRKQEQNYFNIQKETLSEESYQQWLWRKEVQEKEEFKKKREEEEDSYMIESKQAWRPPSRTVPFSR